MSVAMKKPPRMKCEECNGEGSVELKPELAETLAHFVPQAMLTAAEIHKRDPKHKQTAINNRLEKLRLANFLERQKRGRFWKYSLVPEGRRGLKAKK